jgi:uncharacterized protein YjbI with pentapeptide repeats
MSSAQLLWHPVLVLSRLAGTFGPFSPPKQRSALWPIAMLFGFAAMGSCSALAYDSQDLERLQAAGSCLECDLSGADLSGVVRGPVDLRRADLHDAVLAGADLSGARLGDANLRDADLGEAVLEGASLNGANLDGANLDGANLEGALLREADLTRAILWRANLNQADLYRSLLRSADLKEAKLTAASLEETDLGDADLRGADLEGAELYRSSLRSADLRRARLVGATLQDVDLSDADLAGADLANAILTEVRLDGANLAGVDLPEAEAFRERSAGPMPEIPGEEDEAPERSEPPVRVFYGTDRRPVGDSAEPAFGGEGGDKLTLGVVEVTIPREHQFGIVEQQSWWSVALGLDEDPDNHFTIHKIITMGETPFFEEVDRTVSDAERYKDQLFVFVHGYNMTFESAAFRTAQIAYDLQFDGAPVMYSWPSRGGLTSYEYDQISAVRSREYLRTFLLMLKKQSGAAGINLIAHSMGNLALMEVIRDITSPEGLMISRSFSIRSSWPRLISIAICFCRWRNR